MNVALDFPMEALEDAVRRAVADALARPSEPQGFLDVAGAAGYLSTTDDGIRALVKRGKLPVHRTPNGRLLFDRDELRAWVKSG